MEARAQSYAASRTVSQMPLWWADRFDRLTHPRRSVGALRGLLPTTCDPLQSCINRPFDGKKRCKRQTRNLKGKANCHHPANADVHQPGCKSPDSTDFRMQKCHRCTKFEKERTGRQRHEDPSGQIVKHPSTR